MFEGQKLIYSGFIDNTFGENIGKNRSSGGEIYSEIYSENDDDNDDDDDDDDDVDDDDDNDDDDDDDDHHHHHDDDDEFYTPRGMLDLKSEKSDEKRRNQEGQGLKILTPD